MSREKDTGKMLLVGLLFAAIAGIAYWIIQLF